MLVCWPLLIVEDDPALLRMLTWELEDLGYRVIGATDCRQALAMAESEDISFSLALLDYHLPDGDGIQLLQELKRRMPGLPVVLTSAIGGPETANRALHLGAAHFVPKPATTALLHRLFQALLAKQSSSRSRR